MAKRIATRHAVPVGSVQKSADGKLADQNIAALREAQVFKKRFDKVRRYNEVAREFPPRSSQYVREVMKLLNLIPSLRARFERGKFLKSTAIALGQYDDVTQQNIAADIRVNATLREVIRLANKDRRRRGIEKRAKSKRGNNSAQTLQRVRPYARELRREAEKLEARIAQSEESPATFLQGAVAGLRWALGEIEDIRQSTSYGRL